MENNELNNKILRNVRSRIVVSNLEREESMKIEKRKQIVSLCATTLILLSGSFFTVNAATEGKLVEDIKEKYKEFITIDYDQSKYKLTNVKEEKTSTGENTIHYTLMSEDGEEQIDTMVNVDNINKEGLKITTKDKSENDGETAYEMIIEER